MAYRDNEILLSKANRAAEMAASALEAMGELLSESCNWDLPTDEVERYASAEKATYTLYKTLRNLAAEQEEITMRERMGYENEMERRFDSEREEGGR